MYYTSLLLKYIRRKYTTLHIEAGYRLNITCCVYNYSLSSCIICSAMMNYWSNQLINFYNDYLITLVSFCHNKTGYICTESVIWKINISMIVYTTEIITILLNLTSINIICTLMYKTHCENIGTMSNITTWYVTELYWLQENENEVYIT